MGTKIYCEKCKKDFVVYHTNLELIKIWPDDSAYGRAWGCEFENHMYSCPRCDEVIIEIKYND